MNTQAQERAGIYYTAVVPDRTSPDHEPYVATPLGPFTADEKSAQEAAQSWLRHTYRTEDIRRVEPPSERYDFQDARGLVIQAVHREHEARLRAAEQERITRLTAPQTVRVAVDEITDLDQLLSILGVDPTDV